MISIENASLELSLDPRQGNGDPLRGYFATATVDCQLKIEEDVDSQSGYHLSFEIFGVDPNNERSLLTPVTWGVTNANGDSFVTGIYRIYSSTPAGTLPVTRTAYIAHNILDEDPATPLFTPWGIINRRDRDELVAVFTVTHYRYNGPPSGRVIATAEAFTDVLL